MHITRRATGARTQPQAPAGQGREGEVALFQAGQAPTPHELARLHHLSEQSRDLAQQVNAPLTALLCSSLFLLPQHFMTEERVRACARPIEERPFYVQIPILFSAIVLAAYLYMKLWNGVSRLLLWTFPRGVTLERRPEPAQQVAHQLCTRQQVRMATTRLEGLVAQQTRRKSIIDYVTFLFCAAWALRRLVYFPTPAQRMTGTAPRSSIQVMFSFTGPYLTVHREGDPRMGLVSLVIHKQQGLTLLRMVYRLWNRMRSGSRLLHFSQQLTVACGKHWKPLEDRGPASLTYVLTLSGVETTIRAGGESLSVPSSVYTAELFRALREEGLAAHRTGETALCLTYCKVTAAQAQRVQAKLVQRLQVYVRNEQNIHRTLAVLNELSRGIEQPKWDVYFRFNRRTGEQPVFYLNSRHVSEALQAACARTLQELFPAPTTIVVEGGVIQISNATLIEDQAEVRRLSAALQAEYTTQRAAEVALETAPETGAIAACAEGATRSEEGARLVPLRRRSQHEERAEAAPVRTSPSLFTYPDALRFKNGFIFVRLTMAQAEKPAYYTYPLHIPWLPEGRAYAVLHHDIQGEMRQRARTVLEAGRVTGRAFGTGIQNSTDLYETLEGEVSESRFKLKLTDNIRIFGRAYDVQRVGGTSYTLYMFDGPARGH